MRTIALWFNYLFWKRSWFRWLLVILLLSLNGPVFDFLGMVVEKNVLWALMLFGVWLCIIIFIMYGDLDDINRPVKPWQYKK